MADASPLQQWLQRPGADRTEELSRDPGASARLIAFGDDCERLAASEVAKAIDAIDQILADAGRSHLDEPKPRLLRAKVTALAYAGRLQESLIAAAEGESIARRLGRSIDAARIQIASLHPLTKLGRFDDAIRIGNEARSALDLLNEPALAARADINLGSLHKAAGHPDLAAEHLERARAALRNEPRMVAHIENTLGEVHYLRDDLVASRAAFLAALGHFTECSDRFAAAIVEGNLADLAAREGNLQEALTYFERSRRVLERDTVPGHAARLAAEEAELLACLGVPGEAEGTLDAAVAWLEAQGFAIEAARARLARAHARARQGRLDDATEDLGAVIALARGNGHQRLLQRARLLDCEIALLGDNIERAHGTADELLRSESLPPIDRLVAAHHRAIIAARRGDVDLASELLGTIIGEARSKGLAPLASEFLVSRASLAREPSDAIRDLRQAVDEIERVRSTIAAERLRAAWLGSRTQAHERLALALLNEGSRGSIDAAFEAVEQSKSRSLLDLVQRAVDRCKPAAPSDDDERRLTEDLDQLRRRLNALYARWDDEGSLGERRVTAPLGKVVADIRESEMALQRITSRLAALQGERSVLASPLSASDVRSRLGADSALVEYFVADGALFAFVLRNDSIRFCARIGEIDRVASIVARMLFSMRRATRTQARGLDVSHGSDMPELRELHELLLRPIVSEIADASRLIVVPHGVLHGVPFHALYDGSRHVIDRFRVSTAPSAALAVARTKPGSGRPTAPLIIGVPDRAAPSIAIEVDAVATVWPGATVLREEFATAAAFMASASNANVLHLACHGRFAESMPWASGLRLSDRWVSLREILSLHLRADLVILAGCDTGRATIEPGDEQIGLARSFLAAGARAVIVSQWPVGDSTAAEFMIDLHRRLAADGTGDVPESVRTTSLAMRTGHHHPALWGAFGIVG
ncbi:MAG: CHAT domain-containing protein [Phycisphaerae bacterium]|jgi:CHAT domain-containing protein/tetratricopeptide (TPR) repeat protein|nr:CHAT domain-containing protein [Phycisphaerae bacterium]